MNIYRRRCLFESIVYLEIASIKCINYILTRYEVTLVNEVAAILLLVNVKCLGCDGLPFPFLVLFCFISLKVVMSVNIGLVS